MKIPFKSVPIKLKHLSKNPNVKTIDKSNYTAQEHWEDIMGPFPANRAERVQYLRTVGPTKYKKAIKDLNKYDKDNY